MLDPLGFIFGLFAVIVGGFGLSGLGNESDDHAASVIAGILMILLSPLLLLMTLLGWLLNEPPPGPGNRD